jgi:hypothetical protein
LASNTAGQVADPNNNTTTAVAGSREDQSQKEAMAESIVAREEAQSGRIFDPAFRARAKEVLASLSPSALEAQQSQIGLGTNALGDSGADLVYTPVTPCRIIDTRFAGGPIAAGFTRAFKVTGNTTSQGGANCGVPFGTATAAMLNLVAVGFSGPGDLRVTPFGTAMPNASILNFAIPGQGLNLANGLAVTICNPNVTTCTNDMTVQVDGSTTNLVVDILGYFKRATPGVFLGSTQGNDDFLGPIAAGGNLFVTTNYVPPVNVRAFTFNRCSWGSTGAGQVLSFRSAIRTPTGTGAVSIGTAFYLFPSSAGTETIFNENNDWFDLTAGQGYDFGMSFGYTTPGGTGTCSTVVQFFTR